MICGDRVSLTADIPAQARAWRNQPEVWRWCRQYTLLDAASHAAWLESLAQNPTIKMFGVLNNMEHEPVGVAGLTSIDRLNQSAEFSLYIAPEFWGRGYGRDALKTLFRHGFMDHNLNRIWGETYDGNPALSLFKSLGMNHEGTLRQAYFRHGRFIDVHRVSLLRGEFL